MAILPAMRQRKARRIGEPARRAVHDLGNQSKGSYRARAYAGDQQQLGEILRPQIGGRGESAMQAALDDVLGPDVVMGGHDEMWQFELIGGCRRAPWLELGELVCDAAEAQHLPPLGLALARAPPSPAGP